MCTNYNGLMLYIVKFLCHTDALMESGKPVSPRESGSGNSHISSPTLVLLVMIAAIGAVMYLKFLLTPANRGDIVPYVLVILAETFIVAQGFFSMWTILAGSHNPRHYEFHSAQDHLLARRGTKKRIKSLGSETGEREAQMQFYLHEEPLNIDVFVTVYNEPLDVIQPTVQAARDIIGFHQTYILDDGDSDDVKALANELNVGYIRREGSAGAKAGNINHALSVTNGNFFAIFDADFVARPNFLYETIPFFEDEHIAFVQTPQHYDNLHNVISRGAGYMQRLFYRLIQPGKNRFNAAFCVGTNVVFRRSAVDSIGGMYQQSKSEDIWTSILLHERGYRSVFIPDILAVGHTPDTIKAYSKQQLRWATGGFQILLKHNPLTKPLTFDQKLQYLSTTSYYLHGLAVMILLALPALHIFFNWTPVNLHIPFSSWLLFYVSFYGMQIVLAFVTIGGFRWESLLLAMVSFPIYVRAFVNAIRGKEEAWVTTGNRSNLDSPFNYIVPQLLIFLFLCFSTLVALWKTYYYQTWTLSLFWSAVNTVIFGTFIGIAWREHRMITRVSKPAETSTESIIVTQAEEAGV